MKRLNYFYSKIVKNNNNWIMNVFLLINVLWLPWKMIKNVFRIERNSSGRCVRCVNSTDFYEKKLQFSYGNFTFLYIFEVLWNELLIFGLYYIILDIKRRIREIVMLLFKSSESVSVNSENLICWCILRSLCSISIDFCNRNCAKDVKQGIIWPEK